MFNACAARFYIEDVTIMGAHVTSSAVPIRYKKGIE
jgi:hypothetical protein